MIRLAILTLALLLACGRSGERDPDVSADLRAALHAKASRYLSLVPTTQDPHGFIATDKCDSLLLTGLLSVAVPIDLRAAEIAPGHWQRRPANYPECFATGASRSTISRDMLLGVLWWAWKSDRLDALESLRDYGRSHNWIMGEADSAETLYGRAYLTPAFRGTLCRTVRKMGGAEDNDCLIPQIYTESLTDFEAHLQVLTILLESEVSGSISASALEALDAQVKRQPLNPLFHAALSRFRGADHANTAARLLLSAPTWPSDRLPDSASACSPWPVMHDYGSDYEPCPDRAESYSGGDLLFISYVLGVL